MELKLTATLAIDVPVGGAFVLYLEDDYAMPDSISASDVYFVSRPPAGATDKHKLVTGNGSRVYATVNPEIDTAAHFTADKKDFDIRVSVPDMCANNEAECEGANGLMDGDTITMVIQKSAGIKNPSEAGTHSVGTSVLGPTDDVGGPSYRTDKVFAKASKAATDAQFSSKKGRPQQAACTRHTLKSADVGLMTVRKIGLSDVDNKRGYEQTVTGSGFKDGTTAGVYVLHIMGTEPGNAMRNAYLWNALNCDEMNDAFGLMGDNRAEEKTSPCTPYSGLIDAHEMSVDGAKFFSEGPGEAALCAAIIRDGTEVGSALVGSDDKVAVTFEVTAPHLRPRPDQPHLHGRRHGQGFCHRR